MNVSEFGRLIEAEVGRVIVGKQEVVAGVLATLLAEGHVLLDDVPGVAKTLIVKSMAGSLGLRFSRVQCTPDLLPMDVTGSMVFDQRTSDFSFRPGPVFANIVLADEINRATPRTQSAFLEAMEERHVTVEGESHDLPTPFFVLATQNPVEHRGTFPLPEAQLDRFAVRLRVGYPTLDEELTMLDRFHGDGSVPAARQAAGADDVLAAQAACRAVEISPDVAKYLAAIVRATRERDDVVLGASPRSTLVVMRLTQALAALDGRSFAIPDDVATAAGMALAHRIMLRGSDTTTEGQERAIASVLQEITVPAETPAD